MKEKNKNFGMVLRELRISKNLTQEQLGLYIEKTTAAIGQFERGEVYPGYQTLEKIVRVLNADANLFFSKETIDYPEEAKWIANILSEMNVDERIRTGKFLEALSAILRKPPKNDITEQTNEESI